MSSSALSPIPAGLSPVPRPASASSLQQHGTPTQSASVPVAPPARPLSPPRQPSNSDIESVIQAATASSTAAAASLLGRSPLGTPGGGVGASGRDGRTQLYVGNLPYRVRWQDLKDLFRKSGTVLRADVALGPDNRSRGYGTVLMGNEIDAAKAIEMYNGYSWQTRTLEVRPDRLPPEYDLPLPPGQAATAAPPGSIPPHLLPPHHHPPPPPSHSPTPWIHSPQPPHPPPPAAAPERRGPPGSLGPMPPPLFSHLSTPAIGAAQKAMSPSGSGSAPPIVGPAPGFLPPLPPGQGLSPHGPMGGRPSPAPQNFAGRVLFVGNLPFHVQWQDLKDLFRTAGNILRADVALGPDGRSRGFGTVLFASEADAANAVRMFHGYEYSGRQLKVHFDKYNQLPGGGGQPGISPPMHGLYLPYPLASPSSEYPMYTSGQLPLPPPPPPPQGMFPHDFGVLTPDGSAPFPPSPFYAPSPAFIFPPPPAPRPPTPQPIESPLLSDVPPTGLGLPPSEELAKPNPPKPEQNGVSAAERHADDAPTESRPPATHPGPIQLPPMQIGGPFSPLNTTRGVPMTPSMPGFFFHPPYPQTPPLLPQFLSPGLGPFSPGVLGPASPPTHYNPFLNPAPGAPLHLPPGTPQGPPGYNPMFPPFPSLPHQPQPYHAQSIASLGLESVVEHAEGGSGSAGSGGSGADTSARRSSIQNTSEEYPFPSVVPDRLTNRRGSTQSVSYSAPGSDTPPTSSSFAAAPAPPAPETDAAAPLNGSSGSRSQADLLGLIAGLKLANDASSPPGSASHLPGSVPNAGTAEVAEHSPALSEAMAGGGVKAVPDARRASFNVVAARPAVKQNPSA